MRSVCRLLCNRTAIVTDFILLVRRHFVFLRLFVRFALNNSNRNIDTELTLLSYCLVTRPSARSASDSFATLTVGAI